MSDENDVIDFGAAVFPTEELAPIGNAQLEGLMESYFSARQKLEVVDEEHKTAKKELERAEIKLLEEMKAANFKQIKDSKNRLVYIMKPKVYASFQKNMRETAENLIKNEWGLADLFQESISSATLSKVIKERLESNLPVPDAYFSIFLKESIGHRGK